MPKGHFDMRRRHSRHPAFTSGRGSKASAVIATPAELTSRKEATMFPLLLWILGVPGLIIILLLLLGVIHI
jgi:hypothetical protein